MGRAALQAAFPVAMTSWVPAGGAGRFTSLPSSTLTPPFTEPIYDAVTGATPLSLWKYPVYSLSNLLSGRSFSTIACPKAPSLLQSGSSCFRRHAPP